MTVINKKSRKPLRASNYERSFIQRKLFLPSLLVLTYLLRQFILSKFTTSSSNTTYYNNDLIPPSKTQHNNLKTIKNKKEGRVQHKPKMTYFNGGDSFTLNDIKDPKVEYPPLIPYLKGQNNEQRGFLENEEGSEGAQYEIDPLLYIIKDEDKFLETLDSCIVKDDDPKPKKCFEECAVTISKEEAIAMNKTSDSESYEEGECIQMRIGILAPPGAIPDTIFELIQNITHNMFPEGSKGRDFFQIIRSTHVPPYGYGKNHGWTKIIRLVTDPLPLALTDTFLYYQTNYKKRDEDTEVNLVKEEREFTQIQSLLRQTIRWHNRLSHVAAHTSLLTVTTTDLTEDYKETLLNILSFILYNRDGSPIMKGGYHNLSLSVVLDKLKNIMYAVEDQSDYIINDTLWKIGILEDLLREEMYTTNNLKDWPAKSFWNVGNRVIQDTESISHRVALDMLPDCNDEHIKCTIKKDKCELDKDVECK